MPECGIFMQCTDSDKVREFTHDLHAYLRTALHMLENFFRFVWLGTLVAGVGGHLPDLLSNGLSNR